MVCGCVVHGWNSSLRVHYRGGWVRLRCRVAAESRATLTKLISRDGDFRASEHSRGVATTRSYSYVGNDAMPQSQRSQALTESVHLYRERGWEAAQLLHQNNAAN